MRAGQGLAVGALVFSLSACVLAWAAWRAALRSRPDLAGQALPLGASRAAADEAPPSAKEGWLVGDAGRRFGTVERHLRGLDVAMAEIGYRYEELHHARRERNWDYAKYQAEKIDLSLRLALERRPQRARSARPFLDRDLPAVLKAVAARDAAKLDAALERLHASCVECHKSEKVLYFQSAVERWRDRAAQRRAP